MKEQYRRRAKYLEVPKTWLKVLCAGEVPEPGPSCCLVLRAGFQDPPPSWGGPRIETYLLQKEAHGTELEAAA